MDDTLEKPALERKFKTKNQKTVSKERIQYLWKRVRNAARTIGRLSKMSKDIQLLGASKNMYIEKASKETFLNSGSKSAKSKSFLLSPKSNIFKYWSVLMFLILLYTLTITPYLVCFIDSVTAPLDYFNLTVDMLFCVDIVVNMFLAYEDDEGVLITDRQFIIKHYLKSWFLIDLISSIPFQFIEQKYIRNNYNKLFRLLRLPRLYKLFKVFRMNRIIRIFKRYGFVKKILHLLREHNGILNLIKFSVTVTILVHIMGCLWFFTAKFNEFNPDTWVFRHGYINSDTTTLYITSIYFVFTTLTTVGYGDIVAFTTEERVFALIIMSFGVAFYSYTISNLSTIMASIDSRTLNMKARISALNEFAKATKLPEDLKQRIKSHILLNYEENIFSWFDQDSLMNELPSSLRTEVSLHMHHKIVEKVYFFQDKDPGFISYMVPKLRTICLQAGDYLYKEHEYPDEVYFLTKGRVNLLAHNGAAFKTYVQGSYFGEYEILENKTRTCTVQAHKEGAEFLVLSKRHFLKTLEEFPKIAEEIRETARLRGIKNSEAKEEALKLETNTRITLEKKIRLPLARKVFSQSSMEENGYKLERMKSKSVSSTREKNRKMWQNLIKEKKEEEIKATREVPKGKSESKWDMMMKNIFRRKSNLATNNIRGNENIHQSDTIKEETTIQGKSGLLERTLTMHPASASIQSPVTKIGSKWNIVRGKYNEILQMSKENNEPIDLWNEATTNKVDKLDWLLDDAEVNSPLGSDDEKKQDPKLLLLKTLNSHLAQHNLRMQYKINVARKAFSMLKIRQDYIKTQIDSLYQAAIKKLNNSRDD
ncbi:hypothetical protein SteCoe_2474 [Stentor coeruleus]|uniref:Cyclic nucleotide-binding domain-containing protein n=1 Tax=Stentor coeruleus TaxID=5963 RepID=A0A1R2CZM1_9CILI|nr:hypothetical protein SteCoe_2474 [Stentor coeruleus]